MTCRAKTKTHRLCRNYQYHGSDFCYLHTPIKRTKPIYNTVLKYLYFTLLFAITIKSFTHKDEPEPKNNCEIDLTYFSRYFFTRN